MRVMTLTTGSIDKFQESLSARGRSPNTVKAYGSDLRKYLEAVGEHDLEEFEDRAALWLTEVRKTSAAKTVRRYLGTLRVFGKWAGLSDPLADYLAPTPAKPRPHPLPEGIDGVRELLRVASTPDERNLVTLCGLVGLRVGEAVAALATDVDLVDQVIKVRGKGDRERIVPLSDRVVDTLKPRLESAANGGDPRLVRYHERSARKAITRLGEVAGLARRASSHDLRATFATTAYANTGDLRAVQELLGHADSRTTEVYTGISMDKMRKAADVMGDGE
jgi:site-specific recombinase XerD